MDRLLLSGANWTATAASVELAPDSEGLVVVGSFHICVGRWEIQVIFLPVYERKVSIDRLDV